jgi:hypothetical protein
MSIRVQECIDPAAGAAHVETGRGAFTYMLSALKRTCQAGKALMISGVELGVELICRSTMNRFDIWGYGDIKSRNANREILLIGEVELCREAFVKGVGGGAIYTER